MDMNTEILRKFLKDRSGYDLSPDKNYLLDLKLRPVMEKAGINGIEKLITELSRDPDSTLAQNVMQAMTINETMFFRDQRPFDIIRDHILPALYKSKNGAPIQIWSSACSSGQEAYSLSIIMEEERHKYPHLDYRILGTDICQAMVDRARTGQYTDFETQRGLSDDIRARYFIPFDGGWKAQDILRRQITFQQMNLMNPTAAMGPFDLVLCRNVLIYFDDQGKRKLLGDIRARLSLTGYLIVGASEIIKGVSHDFAPHPEWPDTYVST